MIKQFIDALLGQLDTLESTYQAAHDVGVVLHALDDGSLRELRNELAAHDGDDPSLQAAITVLVEMLDGYRAGFDRARTTTVRDTARDILDFLAKRPGSTSELAEALQLDESTISRTLTRLRSLSLLDPALREEGDLRRSEHRLSLRAEQAIARLGRTDRAASSWRLSLVNSPPPIESDPPKAFASARATPTRPAARAPLDGAPPTARKSPPSKSTRTTPRRLQERSALNTALLSLKKI